MHTSIRIVFVICNNAASNRHINLFDRLQHARYEHSIVVASIYKRLAVLAKSLSSSCPHFNHQGTDSRIQTAPFISLNLTTTHTIRRDECRRLLYLFGLLLEHQCYLCNMRAPSKIIQRAGCRP
jgi:Fe-S-cluster containining protein